MPKSTSNSLEKQLQLLNDKNLQLKMELYDPEHNPSSYQIKKEPPHIDDKTLLSRFWYDWSWTKSNQHIQREQLKLNVSSLKQSTGSEGV